MHMEEEILFTKEMAGDRGKKEQPCVLGQAKGDQKLTGAKRKGIHEGLE